MFSSVQWEQMPLGQPVQTYNVHICTHAHAHRNMYNVSNYNGVLCTHCNWYSLCRCSTLTCGCWSICCKHHCVRLLCNLQCSEFGHPAIASTAHKVLVVAAPCSST